MRTKEIGFTDLEAQYTIIKDKVTEALERVLAHGQYILGPEVQELERALEKFCGAKYAISCANGTDALVLALMSQNLGPDDCVFVPTFTFTATASSVATVGGRIVFVDVDEDTFNLDPKSLLAGIKKVQAAGMRPRVVIPVDLFGQAADYDAIFDIARQHDMFVIADSAQSFGASYHGRRVGTLGHVTTTSFYPAKPLGCYGDGGCVFTDDEQLASLLDSLRMYGKGESKYDTVRVGINSRLDTMQAAILLEKLKMFPQELDNRQRIAQRYDTLLKDVAHVPLIKEGLTSSWAQYTIKLKNQRQRDSVQAKLKTSGIPTVVYYHKPMHRQIAYQHCLKATDELPNADRLASTVLSLPMSPYLNFSEHYVSQLTHAFEHESELI
jgi:dTDP-4-amino-4,6-dideoxygalactose transaminase